MESLTPNFFVKNMTETIAFYETLGFKTMMTVPDDGVNLVWAMMGADAVTVMFQTFESLEELPEISRQAGGSLLLYVKLKGIRDFHASIESKVRVIKPMEKAFYGATEFSIVDNNGFVITFAEDE